MLNETEKIVFEIQKIASEIKKEAIEFSLQSQISNYRLLLQKIEQKKTEPDNSSAIRYLNFLSFLLTQQNVTKSTMQRNILVEKIQKIIDRQNNQEKTSGKSIAANWSANTISSIIKKMLEKYEKKN